MKKLLKIFLWILSGIFILIVLALIYFLFIFKLPVAALCISQTEFLEDEGPIACESVDPCIPILVEYAKKNYLLDVDVPESEQELVTYFTWKIVEQVAVCNGLCKSKEFRDIDAGDVCKEGEDKFTIYFSGMEMIKNSEALLSIMDEAI
jgi:hypothetical protein